MAASRACLLPVVPATSVNAATVFFCFRACWSLAWTYARVSSDSLPPPFAALHAVVVPVASRQAVEPGRDAVQQVEVVVDEADVPVSPEDLEDSMGHA